MSILINEHTFLILSFVLAGWGLYKLIYKKLDKSIEATIGKIRKTIQNNDIARKEAEAAINELREELNKLIANAQDEKERNHNEAIKRANQNEAKIAIIIEQKKQECRLERARIENGLISEILNAYIQIFIKRMKERLLEKHVDGVFQAAAVNSSISMLERYVSKNK